MKHTTEDLSKVLEECKEAAQVGYQIASEEEKDLSQTLVSAKEKLQTLEAEMTHCNSQETTDLLRQQILEVHQLIDRHSCIKDDLETLRNNMGKFSITLFGRTMAGKSTLMEILTNGNGETIGKGGQRTTRDIRKYTWNNLEITDVPGIGAFEGQEDEDIAFEAAKTADLILFLITNDAPQTKEADCFSRLIDLGKPVICIFNVKSSVSENGKLKLIKRDINKVFNDKKNEDIREQFIQFSNRYGQVWEHIPFVYVHLRAAYLAQHSNAFEDASELHRLSRIDDLEKMIIEQVRYRGKFIRIKTFIDSISRSMLELHEWMLCQSHSNSEHGRIVFEKIHKLERWKIDFRAESQKRISSLVQEIRCDLIRKIAPFAEEHYEDKFAGNAWKEVLREQHIELRCQELFKNFNENINNKFVEVSREIANEFEFISSFCECDSIRGKKIFDWRMMSRVFVNISKLICMFIPQAKVWGPWIVNAIGSIFDNIFKSREEKIREARISLECKIRQNVSSVCDNVEIMMKDKLDKLIYEQIDVKLKRMNKINSEITQLAEMQKIFAWMYNMHLIGVNRPLGLNGAIGLNGHFLKEALRAINAEGLEWHVQSVARVPGKISLLMLCDGSVFPEAQHEQLKNMMSEKIDFIYKTETKEELIAKILGINREQVKLEEKENNHLANVSLEEMMPDMINKILLAQQLSGVQIVRR